MVKDYSLCRYGAHHSLELRGGGSVDEVRAGPFRMAQGLVARRPFWRGRSSGLRGRISAISTRRFTLLTFSPSSSFGLTKGGTTEQLRCDVCGGRGAGGPREVRNPEGAELLNKSMTCADQAFACDAVLDDFITNLKECPGSVQGWLSRNVG